jgi:homoserine kinase
VILCSMWRVRVPATSANLGPGFDCLGIAVHLFLEVDATPSDRDSFDYQGAGSLPDHPDNLIHQSFRGALQQLGIAAPSMALQVRNPIPLARGLGSSSAALVAGAALADAFSGGRLGRSGVFEYAAAVEGHPDNVAPAIYGNFTVSAPSAPGDVGSYTTSVLPIPQRWRFLFGVPAFELPTEQARAALPELVSRGAAVQSAARSALWALAVARDEPELLRTASIDVLHEPYREPLVPGLAQVRAALRDAGAFAAYLSGAGPSVAAVVDDASSARCEALLERFVGDQGAVLRLSPAGGFELHELHERHLGS